MADDGPPTRDDRRPAGVHPEATTRLGGSDPEVSAVTEAWTAPEPSRPGGGPAGGEARELIEAGQQVDRFRVVRFLGRGGMGEVYLARDTGLGRKVALKVLHPRSLGSPGAVERFLHEARTTARFSHPHIVTVYAVGEHRGSPYLALEYLEGETLRQRMRRDPPAVPEAARIGLAVAEALREAHHHQVTHRDLKPENVMIPRDGRIRVVDFGLAKVLRAPPPERDPTASAPATATQSFPSVEPFESHGDGLRGTPGYMAPEQWAGGAISPATDVWALGVLLYELISRRHPYQGLHLAEVGARVCGPDPVPSLEAEVPSDVAELVEQCLEKDPALRPGVDAAIETLRRFLVVRDAHRAEARPPFRGLLPCDARDADRFFGRETELAAFLERLREVPVLPVVGPSGAGKSSFVQAGVIPRLREQGRWVVVRVRPGRQPLRALAAGLLWGGTTRASRIGSASWAGSQSSSRRTRDPDASSEDLQVEELSLADELREAPSRAALRLAELADREASRVLLFVDQLEELYTLGTDAAERGAFMDALCGAADDPQGPVRAVFTLRDDFLGRVAEGERVREALGRLVVLRSPGVEALEEIVRRTVEVEGYRFDDPALVREMVAEIRGEPSALPLLQVAGQLLWERRDETQRLLRRDAYEALGGVAGALAHHADGVLEGLTPGQVQRARALLVRMVTPEGTRAVVPRDELLEVAGEGAGEVLDRLVQGRLVLTRKARSGARPAGATGGGDGAEVELAHESLIERWDRLARWLEAGREELAFLAEVGQAAELWAQRGEPDDEVWQGDALHDARRRADRLALVPAVVQRFLAAGLAKERRRQRARRLGVAAAFAALALVAAVLALQTREAVRQRAEAEAERAAVQREATRAAMRRGDLLEARARLRSSLEVADAPLARALWWQLRGDPLRWTHDTGAVVGRLAFSPDGAVVAAPSNDTSIHLIDVATRDTRVLRDLQHRALAADFHPDGRRLAGSAYDGTLAVWDLERGEAETWKGHEIVAMHLRYAPDGALLASTGWDQVVRLWDAETRELVRELPGLEHPAVHVAWAPDGASLVAAGIDGVATEWDVASGTLRRRWQAHDAALAGVAYAPDGRRLATVGYDHLVRVWSAADAVQLAELVGHTAPGLAVDWSPDGARIASSARDDTVRLWDADSGAPRAVYRDHDNWVDYVRFGPDSRLLATGSRDYTVRLYDVRVEDDAPVERGHRSGVNGVDVSPDGALIATASSDKTVRLWSAADGTQRAVLEGHGGEAHLVRFLPGGDALASSGADHTIRIWDLAAGAERQVLRGHEAPVFGLDVSADGRWLVSGAWDRTVRLWDLQTGREERVLYTARGAVWACRFSPDGRSVAVGSDDGPVAVVDVQGRRSPQKLVGHPGRVWGVAFAPDGRHLLSGGEEGALRWWDLAAGRGAVLAEPCEGVHVVALDPAGTRAVAACRDGSAHVVGLDGEPRAVLRGPRGEANGVTFDPTGERIAVTSDDGTVRLFEAGDGRPCWAGPQVRQDGDVRCTLGHDGTLEVAVGGAAVATHPVGDAARLEAAPAGCLVLRGDGRVGLYDRLGGLRALHDSATAIAVDGDDLLVAGGREVRRLGADGTIAARYPADVGVRALAPAGAWLAVGYAEGTLELVPTGADGAESGIRFEDVPSGPVERILPGPMDTIVAGYADGQLGIWSLRSGSRLAHHRLHGPVTDLQLRDHVLTAGTELGDRETLDLDVLYRDHCDVLREVWDEVPVVWESGRVVRRAPPGDHACVR